MTIKEKRKALMEYCDGKYCDDCELRERSVLCNGCYNANVEDEVLEENYNIVFGEEQEDEHDNVNHPSHYETGKFECIEVMMEVMGIEAVKSFCICNAFKYLYRHKKKNGNEDLEKAKWYIDKYLELSEKEVSENESKKV